MYEIFLSCFLIGTISSRIRLKVRPGAGEADVGVSDPTGSVASSSQLGSGKEEPLVY